MKTISNSRQQDNEQQLAASLLPENRSPAPESIGGDASVSGAVFNLSTSIIGAGIMSIPATLRVLGTFPALIIIVVAAILADSSVEFLMRYAVAGSSGMSYSGLMKETFGRGGALALQLCVAVTNTGCLVMYIIIIGDVLSGKTTGAVAHSGILQEWFGTHWWNARAVALLLVFLLVLLPLGLLRSVVLTPVMVTLGHELFCGSLATTYHCYCNEAEVTVKFVSYQLLGEVVHFRNFSAPGGVFMIISSGLAIYSIFHGTIQTPKILPDFAHQSVFELFTAVPVIVVAFTFHFNVHPIRAELNSTSDMTIAVRTSLLICSIIYATVGFFCYLLYGEATMDDVLSNFDRTSGFHVSPLINDVVRLSYALHLVLVYPLLFYSLRLNIDQFLTKSQRFAGNGIRFLSLTVLLMIIIYLAAIAIPNIWTVFQFVGSTSAVCLSLIFPGAIVLRDIHGISKLRDKILAAAMIVAAVVTSCIAISSNIISCVNGKSRS